MGAPGIDSGWQWVVNVASQQNWVFGRDVVFTHGPLGYLALSSPDLITALTSLRDFLPMRNSIVNTAHVESGWLPLDGLVVENSVKYMLNRHLEEVAAGDTIQMSSSFHNFSMVNHNNAIHIPHCSKSMSNDDRCAIFH